MDVIYELTVATQNSREFLKVSSEYSVDIFYEL